MPRILKVGVCRVCSVEYVLRDRRYKLTCSPECAFRMGIHSLYKTSKAQGLKMILIQWSYMDENYEFKQKMYSQYHTGISR